MKRNSKRMSLKLSFVPFLIVLFLLVVSAVTSYVVINQGTGGYKSSAQIVNYGQGDGSCATQKGGICKNTSSYCAGTFQSGFCPGPATWKCCVPSDSKISGSIGTTVATPADPKPPTSSPNKINSSLGVTPTTSISIPSPTPNVKFGGLGTTPSPTPVKIAGGFGITPTPTPFTNCNSIGSNCCTSATGLKYCNSASKVACQTSTGKCISSIPTPTATRTPTPTPTLCNAVGLKCCTSATGLKYCNSASKVSCQTSTGNCIAIQPTATKTPTPTPVICKSVGAVCCTSATGLKYCDSASKVACQTSTGRCIAIQPTATKTPTPTLKPVTGSSCLNIPIASCTKTTGCSLTGTSDRGFKCTGTVGGAVTTTKTPTPTPKTSTNPAVGTSCRNIPMTSCSKTPGCSIIGARGVAICSGIVSKAVTPTPTPKPIIAGGVDNAAYSSIVQGNVGGKSYSCRKLNCEKMYKYKKGVATKNLPWFLVGAWTSINARSTCESENVCHWETSGTDQCNVKMASRKETLNVAFNFMYDNILNDPTENVHYSCKEIASVPESTAAYSRTIVAEYNGQTYTCRKMDCEKMFKYKRSVLTKSMNVQELLDWALKNGPRTLCESENVCNWVTDGTDQCNVKNALRSTQPNLFFNQLYDNDLFNNSKENINYSCKTEGPRVTPISPAVPPANTPTQVCAKVGDICCRAPSGARNCGQNSKLRCDVPTGRCVETGVIQDVSCRNLGGTCTNVGIAQVCPDSKKPVLVKNMCPSGGVEIRCCVPKTDGGGPGGGGPGGGGPGGGGPGGGGPGEITVTPETPAGDVTLAFKFKFQGVTKKPRGGQTVPFKVKLRGPSTKGYETGELTVDANGIWNGSVSFTDLKLTDKLGVKYQVFTKVGKHLQKRICKFAPSETSGGTYNCSESEVGISAGTNNLDFSGILILVGDLPSSTGEQNGVVDSYDISFVLNNLGNTDPAKLKIGDLNFDGVIDTQDRSLIIQSLNVKYDDE